MGALPKRKISRQRRGKRRSAKTLDLPTLRNCPQCQTPARPHCACPNCGHYKTGVSITIKDKDTNKSTQKASQT